MKYEERATKRSKIIPHIFVVPTEGLVVRWEREKRKGGRQLEQLEYRIWKEEYSFVFRIKSIESNQDRI